MISYIGIFVKSDKLSKLAIVTLRERASHWNHTSEIGIYC